MATGGPRRWPCPGGTVALDTRFSGALDLSPDSTALYDIGARFYSPSSGAWTQLDTYGGQAQDPASMNRFLYAHANPTTFIDPTGHGVDCWMGQNCSDAERASDQQRWQKYEQRRNGNGGDGGGGSGGGGYVPDGPIETPALPDETDDWWSDATYSRSAFDREVIDYLRDVTANYLAECGSITAWNADSCLPPDQALIVKVGFWADQTVFVSTVILDAWYAAKSSMVEFPPVRKIDDLQALTRPVVQNPRLQNIVTDLYKGLDNPGRIGSGTTADAARRQLTTGVYHFGADHVQKAGQYANALTKWLKRNPNADAHDRLVAQSLLNELLEVLK